MNSLSFDLDGVSMDMWNLFLRHFRNGKCRSAQLKRTDGTRSEKTPHALAERKEDVPMNILELEVRSLVDKLI